MDIAQLQRMKNKQPIVALTAYTAPMARLLDRHADILLVGDSLGMVVYGMENTLQVTMEMMINHGRAVVKSASNAFVVIDMPFRSFEKSPSHAFDNASLLIAETGAGAVKLEGGVEMAETIAYLCKRGIAVMGHIGLMPQRVDNGGGFHLQGREESRQAEIMADALAVESAGAFSMVIEHTISELATQVTKSLSIPTIGIGAGIGCDGQVLVSDDLLGLDRGSVPKFVKKYADLNGVIDKAVAIFADEVRSKKFPEAIHSSHLNDKIIKLKSGS